MIVRENEILLSYEKTPDRWMTPGGGMEEGEDDRDCCIREMAEETGMIVKPSECLLEIHEYLEDWKWVNRYYFCEVVGTVPVKLTEWEKKMGLEPRWIPIEEAKAVFAGYNAYAEADDMRRTLYLREYTALCALLK